MNNLVVFLADGFEEIEAITIIDVLRRADLPVLTVSLGSVPLAKGAHDINVETDFTLENLPAEEFTMLIFPGGAKGVENLIASEGVKELIAKQRDKNIAAICAAPSLLAQHGVLEGRQATSYPSFAEKVKAGKANYTEDAVVVDNEIITSRGPGTAMQFSLTIVRKLKGDALADKLAQAMLVA